MGFSMSGMQGKKILRGSLCAALVFAVALTAASVPAAAAKKRTRRAHHTHFTHKGPVVDRSSYIVVDAATGTVLSEKDPDKKLYPASLSKMMTLYLTFEALENGTLRKNDRIPVSSHAAAQEPSSLALEPGTTIRVEDAILGLATKSANDAAVVLGERLGGSESHFGALMTAKAHQLGMNNSHFVNASGLFNPNQQSSARDMATLGLALIRDYPQHYRYFSTPSFTWAGQQIINHNRLMQTYSGMDGIKTGYVHQSGFNLVASAVRGGRRLVGVIFGGRTTASRNAQMASLLNAGFAQASAARIAANGNPRFDTLGLVMKHDVPEQGDTSAGQDTQDNTHFVEQLRPKSLNTAAIGAKTASVSPAGGSWAIQLGAFGSTVSGMQALQDAKKRLALQSSANARAVVVPLVTNRGTIYRARLMGLDKQGAESACRILKGNCLILAVE